MYLRMISISRVEILVSKYGYFTWHSARTTLTRQLLRFGSILKQSCACSAPDDRVDVDGTFRGRKMPMDLGGSLW